MKSFIAVVVHLNADPTKEIYKISTTLIYSLDLNDWLLVIVIGFFIFKIVIQFVKDI